MNVKEMKEIKVGAPFTIKNKRGKSDGAYFESLGEGLWLQSIYLTNISPAEKSRIMSSDAEFRFLKESVFLFPLISYGPEFIFEMDFDPTLYLRNEIYIDYESIVASNKMVAVLIDAETNIVQVIRSLNIPDALFSVMKDTYAHAFDVEGFSERHASWTGTLRQRDILELWNSASLG